MWPGFGNGAGKRNNKAVAREGRANGIASNVKAGCNTVWEDANVQER